VTTTAAQRLLIIGAGGFGREVLGWALDMPAAQRGWEVSGFLDDNPAALASRPAPIAVIGAPLDYPVSANDRLVCAIGDPRTKLSLCRALKARGGQFITLIHPTAVVGPACEIGEGCILCPGAVITTNVTLGRFVAVNVCATVGHDAVVGEGCTLSGHADVTGFARLGEGVFLGSHASVLPGATVGNYAVVGAGSVVLRKVKAGVSVMGVPARQIAGFGGLPQAGEPDK